MNTNDDDAVTITEAHMDTAVRVLRELLNRSNGASRAGHDVMCAGASIGQRAGMLVITAHDPTVTRTLLRVAHQAAMHFLQVDEQPHTVLFAHEVADADRSPGMN